MNREKLIETLCVQTTTGNDAMMVAFIKKELAGIDCKWSYSELDGNFYITKGESDCFPCVVAHLDTVHKIVEDLCVITVGNKLTGFNRTKMTQTGIGGDDKVGIFIAMECLRLFPNIKVALFCDEEVGCFGSYEADMKFFDDVGFVLQCDRKGNSDFIHNAGNVPLLSRQFKKAVKRILKDHGYAFNHGMMTDVMALKENGLHCSCANIACGYYNPHMDNEYVDMVDVENCLDMVMQVIHSLGGEYFPHSYTVPKYTYNYTKNGTKYLTDKMLPATTKADPWSSLYGRRFWEDDEKLTPSKEEKWFYCQCCCEDKPKVTHIPYYGVDLCDDCVAQYCDQFGQEDKITA